MTKTPKVKRLRSTLKVERIDVRTALEPALSLRRPVRRLETVTKMRAFRFNEEDFARWKALASRDGVTMTEFIRVACNLRG